MMSWLSLRESLKRISPPYFILIGLLLIAVFYFASQAQSEKDFGRLMAIRAQNYQQEVERMRLEQMPREFASLSELETWATLRQFEVNIPADQSRARKIQAQAAKDGKALSIQIVINSVTKQTEFWPTARIGDKFYVIEPVTNQVTLFYPTEWWR